MPRGDLRLRRRHGVRHTDFDQVRREPTREFVRTGGLALLSRHHPITVERLITTDRAFRSRSSRTPAISSCVERSADGGDPGLFDVPTTPVPRLTPAE